MKKSQNGFSLLTILAVLVVVGLITATGWYVYRSNQVATETFDELADVSTAQPASATRIAAVGDIACDPTDKHFSGADTNYCQMERTHALLTALNPETVLALGDLQYENGAADKFLASYDKSWGKIKSKTYPAPGNHEYNTSGAAGYYGYFGDRAGGSSKGYYSFDVGNWHLVSLNSNCDEVGGCNSGSPQYQWLQQDLKDNPKACTLAYWHHPRFTSGRYSADQPSADRTGGFWQALRDRRTDVALAGHDHLYERFAPQNPDGQADPDGIRHFTVGTGGKVLYKKGSLKSNSEVLIDNQFGVLVLDLYSKAYRWQFISIDNKVLDSGYQQCVV